MRRGLLSVPLAALSLGCGGQLMPEEIPIDESKGALVGFTCEMDSIAEDIDNPAFAEVSSVRAAGHPDDGYDRFVLEFQGGVPSYTVTKRESAAFPTTSGEYLQLAGVTGLELTVTPADAHTDLGRPSFRGPRRFKPTGTAVLREVAQTEDFEGYVTWAFGLSRAACLRAFKLSNPPRVIVDIKH